MSISGLQSLSRLSTAKTRSISAENFTGEKGGGGRATEGTGRLPARDLGQGWKISPSIDIAAGQLVELANIAGPGCIKHIWATAATRSGLWRTLILRMYWEDSDLPSVECPLGDFFASAETRVFGQVASLAVCFNPGRGGNSYWDMPFLKRCRVTLENIDVHPATLYYQIDYELDEQPSDLVYFHAQFRRTNPLPYMTDYTILDGVEGRGQYVGTAMFWQPNNNGWWGEGEIKFFMDGDGDYPTICGTGTEDYFCGAYNFDATGSFIPFTTPYSGLSNVIRPRDDYNVQQRFQMYRWHITDPIHFEKDLRVTIQALGWRSEGRYLPLCDDIASVAYWYQTLPQKPFPAFYMRDQLEII